MCVREREKDSKGAREKERERQSERVIVTVDYKSLLKVEGVYVPACMHLGLYKYMHSGFWFSTGGCGNAQCISIHAPALFQLISLSLSYSLSHTHTHTLTHTLKIQPHVLRVLRANKRCITVGDGGWRWRSSWQLEAGPYRTAACFLSVSYISAYLLSIGKAAASLCN